MVQWLLSKEMDSATQVQILDKANCISRCTNTLGMNSMIVSLALGK